MPRKQSFTILWNRSILRATILAVGPVVFALAIAALVGALLVHALGYNPITAVKLVAEGVRQSPLGVAMDISDVLYRATPLILTGLALALSFRAGLVNIGGQGQFVFGAFVCALVGNRFWSVLSYGLLPFCVAGAFMGGALWAYIPGVMRARRGAHEVITTIMMNFVAVYLTAYLLARFFQDQGNIPQTSAVIDAVRLPRMGELFDFVPGQSPLNVSLFIACAAVFIVHWLLWQTKFGYELRAVGLNPDAASAAGIDCARVRERAMFISGGLIGLATIGLVLGYDYRFCQENAVDYGFAGFLGIAVALMAQNHPFAVVPAALFFGALGRLEFLLKFHAGIPKGIVLVLQAVVIMALILGHELMKRRKNV